MEEIVETKKIATKRIGTFTFGLTLILFGISIILQTLFPFDLLRFILMLWPIIFISIGCETIYYTLNKKIQIKYDLFGILLTLFLVFIGSIFSIANYTINKLLYDDKIQNAVIDSIDNSYHTYYFDNKCNIINGSNIPINVKIIENNKITNQFLNIYSNINYHFNEEDFILKLITYSQRNQNIHQYYDEHNRYNIYINKLPEHIESIDILIYTNNRNNVTLENCTITQ